MKKMKLTAESVKRLPFARRDAAGRVVQVVYRDSELSGFGVRVGEQAKSYFVQKRVVDRVIRVTLGTHGQITAEQARKEAGIRLGALTAGRDLNAEKRIDREARRAAKAAQARAAQFTVEALCDWYVKHQTALGKESAKDAAGIFALCISGLGRTRTQDDA